jgi:hypothetical protein
MATSLPEAIRGLASKTRERRREVAPHVKDRLVAAVETMPPAESEAMRRERHEAACRSLARAVRRGALSERFASLLIRKMIHDAKPMPRTVQLDLPQVTDAASYRQAMNEVALAAAEGRITVDEVRGLTHMLRTTWDAVRAERREQRR